MFYVQLHIAQCIYSCSFRCHSLPPSLPPSPTTEVLNKYVGESELNIRNLFAEAEKEQKDMGINSALHIIIFDELDAICRTRGSLVRAFVNALEFVIVVMAVGICHCCRC